MAASRGVLVTGSSRGIGAAVARRFAAGGDRVAVHSGTSAARAAEVAASLDGSGHVAVAGDLGDPDAVRRFVAGAADGLGRIDVLVDNAALFVDVADPGARGNRRIGHAVADTSYEEWVSAWRRTVEVNLLGTANATWCAVRHMLAVPPASGLPRGRVVVVGSRGAYRGEPDVPAYGASKAGVHALAQSLAVALGGSGIAVTAVAPGFVATDTAAGHLDGPAGDAVRAQSPFGRVATPEEAADAVAWLASPGAEWASGAVVDLNGASYLR